ncbi:hypothetical protein OH76DRAFT_557159 [Lentinus brumalis]|uniref:Uncharacterized protein n=1 Tax=Lentinus brumalis TaxID=2498619 RepID=A0A371D9B3_9APHY|nr:hypothetical protein OH76DRAFT_557159 [Polyporus brumalis]
MRCARRVSCAYSNPCHSLTYIIMEDCAILSFLSLSDSVTHYMLLVEDSMESTGTEHEHHHQSAEDVPGGTRGRVSTYIKLSDGDSCMPSPEPVPVLVTSARLRAWPSMTSRRLMLLFAPPSPPPSVMPRLKSRASLSSACHSYSPLTNRGTCMSVAQ